MYSPQFNSENQTIDRLLAGNEHLVTDTATLLSGETVVRGEVLGKITASGKLIGSLSGAADGSQVPFAIAAEACDASAADNDQCLIFLKGQFNEDQLTIGTAHTAASIKDGLRALGIYLVSPLTA